ncbi:hypothetical protein RIF29_41366 [Crotalaria pallida]|uniref:NB-ARC domain-containing protein n=1 Tax=Crotalaria pallida TaxID=3830 RepID=A0AAN9HSL9_CROPI
MAGVGKTTLAKQVSKDKSIFGRFDCHAWITVSQSSTPEELLKEVLDKFCKGGGEALPQFHSTLDQQSLIDAVRDYLQHKRYVVFFDDVWDIHFWAAIGYAFLDNNLESRVLITTRNMDVALQCKTSSSVQIHELHLLPYEKSWELFCKKVFWHECNDLCPLELEVICGRIVKRCHGLPLAIVAIGRLLSTKEKVASEFQKLIENLDSELVTNPLLTGTSRILALSYDDLPFYLKSCFLYFGIYPEGYEIDAFSLTKQWIAEGFVKFEKGKTPEEVAEQYLIELITRSLLKESSFNLCDGKVEMCRVHDLYREMIIRNMDDLSFCHHFASEDEQNIPNQIMRRLSLTGEFKSSENFHGSRIHSLFISKCSDSNLLMSFFPYIPKHYRLLEVLYYPYDSSLKSIPSNLGDLFNLKYLSFHNTHLSFLPKSIGKLQNLETLDLRNTNVDSLPREIYRLKKLCHLLAFTYRTWREGICVGHGIRRLTSLQTLQDVDVNRSGEKVIKELGQLKMLRMLNLIRVQTQHASILSDSVSEMKKLESLTISVDEVRVFNFHFLSPMPQLKKICFNGKLENFSDLVTNAKNLVSLSLFHSSLADGAMMCLENMPSLAHLSICDGAYEGKTLHFQGMLPSLKVLHLRNLYELDSVIIDRGALPILKLFSLGGTLLLKDVPSGIQYLEKLETFEIYDMSEEFEQNICYSEIMKLVIIGSRKLDFQIEGKWKIGVGKEETDGII